MKTKLIKCYFDIVRCIEKLSYCEKKKVGAIIVKDDKIISIGYNGTLPGESNDCESIENGTLVTNDNVIHAELNAIIKISKSAENISQSVLFCSLSPCFECSKLIILSEIKEVYYIEEYRDTKGIELLKKKGIKCIKESEI